MAKIFIRQPLVLRAGVAVVGMGLARIAAWAGWIPDEWANIDQARIEQAIDLIILGVTWRSTHKAVTPVAAPRANDGTTLVPITHPLQRPRPL
ncbi:hypothetical protein ACGFIV_01045 [Sphaerisporangium sp. NPDC049003]|uniref:hypothetical protein n=1 Tax=Sphaerisporangium sp. NPDC049003 TaxID=3364517 RepID=UPI0037142BB2